MVSYFPHKIPMDTLNSNLKSAYSKAYVMACADLENKNPEVVASDTGSLYDREKDRFELKFFQDMYHVSAKDGSVINSNGLKVGDTVLSTLILHYLVNGSGRKLSGKHIVFSGIPGGGSIYDNAYQRRVIIPFVKTFGNDPDLFNRVSKKYEGKEAGYGDLSVTFDLFPFVPVTYVLWRGDEEFAPTATIMFDESVSSYLPVEDIVIMVSFSTYALIKSIKK